MTRLLRAAVALVTLAWLRSAVRALWRETAAVADDRRFRQGHL